MYTERVKTLRLYPCRIKYALVGSIKQKLFNIFYISIMRGFSVCYKCFYLHCFFSLCKCISYIFIIIKKSNQARIIQNKQVKKHIKCKNILQIHISNLLTNTAAFKTGKYIFATVLKRLELSLHTLQGGAFSL